MQNIFVLQTDPHLNYLLQQRQRLLRGEAARTAASGEIELEYTDPRPQTRVAA